LGFESSSLWTPLIDEKNHKPKPPLGVSRSDRLLSDANQATGSQLIAPIYCTIKTNPTELLQNNFMGNAIFAICCGDEEDYKHGAWYSQEDADEVRAIKSQSTVSYLEL